jgi:hypothetical protein
MAVGIGGSPFGDGGHCGVIGLIVIPDDHRQPAPSLTVGEPESADTRLFQRRNDLVNNVFDSSLEVGRGLVLEGDHLCVHLCSSSLVGRLSLPPVIGPRKTQDLVDAPRGDTCPVGARGVDGLPNSVWIGELSEVVFADAETMGRHWGRGAALTATLAACGGQSSAPAESEPTPPASMTTTPSNSVPLKLQGTWLVREPFLLRLKLNEGSYSVEGHSGPAEVEGDVLTFTSTCGDSAVTGVGHYRWTLKGDKLHLSIIGKDECAGRASGLSGTTFERFGY